MGVYYIFQRELRSYFQSFIAYVLIAVFLLLAGYFFYTDLVMYVLWSFQKVAFNKIWGYYFNDLRYMLMIVIPPLTMRLFAEEKKLKGFVLWQMGSFSGFCWDEVYLVGVMGGVLLFGVYLLCKPLNAFLLGEDYAKSMGVNIMLFRFLIVTFSSALAGMVTAFAGPVAFIGLAVPHMARLTFGTSDNKILIPGAALLGAIVTSLCDLIARLLFSPVELPISAITAFFGAPVVIGLLLRRKTAI